MKLNWIDQLGDWNPQLLRELKGRFKPRNLLVTGTISLLGQFLLFVFFQTQLPSHVDGVKEVYNLYCLGSSNLDTCFLDNQGNFVINWQMWWLSLFGWLSLISIFALLVAGTYLLISDLAHEERRDTLNFIRLSPQSPANILVGKLLGVPILLYLVVGSTVPLHLWSGLAAKIPLSLILSFYGVVVASCLFFYTAALLFGLVCSRLGGFQAWLGSSTVFIFLWSAPSRHLSHNPADWLNLFSPSLILQYLVAATGVVDFRFPFLKYSELQWFYLPLGAVTVGMVGFTLLNYGLWTYWSWQALQQRFANSSSTILSKRQSYLLVACVEVVILGFALQQPYDRTVSVDLSFNFNSLLVFNLVLFFGLIVTLTQERQTLQDWARYRRQSRRKIWDQTLVPDLIWGKKSPALVAIALNLAITSAILIPWIMFGLEQDQKLSALLSLVISLNLILLYTVVAQLMVFLRAQKPGLWVTGTVGTMIILPPVILGILSLQPDKTAGLWLFTPFAWASIEHASATSVLLAILGQWGLLTLCTLQMTRQLRRAGESASIALFAGRPSLPSSK